MIQVTRNVKDGEFLITADEIVKYDSSFIEQADVADSPKPIQMVAIMRLLDANNVRPVCYETGSKAIPLYRIQDVGVDADAILGGK